MIQLTMPRTSAHVSDNLCLAKPLTGCTFGLLTFQYQLLLAEVIAHPAPDVRPLEVDECELGRSAFYRVVSGSKDH